MLFDTFCEILLRRRSPCPFSCPQLYEDAVELQMFFIKTRDELCRNGELLLTPALSYTERHLQVELETEKEEKLPKELKEDEEKRKQEAEGEGEKSVSRMVVYQSASILALWCTHPSSVRIVVSAPPSRSHPPPEGAAARACRMSFLDAHFRYFRCFYVLGKVQRQSAPS